MNHRFLRCSGRGVCADYCTALIRAIITGKANATQDLVDNIGGIGGAIWSLNRDI